MDYVFKRGRTEEAAEYALHIQCSWRIAKGNKIEDINEHTIVERVDSDEVGGLKIFLSQGYLLEVFPDTSEDDEYSEFWRLFNRKEDSPHFVVTGNGVKNE